jgi:Short C-terminal domain
MDSTRSALKSDMTTITSASASHCLLAVRPEWIDQTNAARAEALTEEPSTPAASAADELSKLAALHTSGALSDEEFAAAKARMLAD